MGSLTVGNEDLISPVCSTLGRLGIGVSPDDTSLVLRGIETLGVRLNRAAYAARALMERIREHPLVVQILYPALPEFPGHEIWRRDFLGASGVFSVVFQPASAPHLAAALEVLKTFVIGPSWGGTRSLIVPIPVGRYRTLPCWIGQDPVLRISVGLEDIDDLQADLENLLAATATRIAQQNEHGG